MKASRIVRGVMEPNPMLNEFRVQTTDACWWCGALATTEEHRIKASTLRRVGRSDDGSVEAGNVFKKSSDYEGSLRSLKKGAQIRWRKNLCADCNNSRSQPFDRAYDKFEAYLVANFEAVASWNAINWEAVYGIHWREGSTNLARYFGKQLGCMLATYDLPVPEDLKLFLTGAETCRSVGFVLEIDQRIVALMEDKGADAELSKFVGLLEAQAYGSGESFTGIDYGFHIGYLIFWARWRDGLELCSWFDPPRYELGRPFP